MRSAAERGDGGDGKRIVFERNDLAGHDSIFISTLAGTDERAVTHPEANVYATIVRPDGRDEQPVPNAPNGPRFIAWGPATD